MQNIHTMKLRKEPFNKIKVGDKIIESRLLDEKRKLIKLGDVIEFQLEPDLTEKIKVKVLGLLNYPTFSELMSDFPAKHFGWDETQQALDEINKFYSLEDQNKLSVLGIKISLV